MGQGQFSYDNSKELASKDAKTLKKRGIKSPDITKQYPFQIDPKTTIYFHSEEKRKRYIERNSPSQAQNGTIIK